MSSVFQCALYRKMGNSPVTGYQLEDQTPWRQNPTRAQQASFLLREIHISNLGVNVLRVPKDPHDMLRLVTMLVEATHGPMCAEVVKALIRDKEKEVSIKNVKLKS